MIYEYIFILNLLFSFLKLFTYFFYCHKKKYPVILPFIDVIVNFIYIFIIIKIGDLFNLMSVYFIIKEIFLVFYIFFEGRTKKIFLILLLFSIVDIILENMGIYFNLIYLIMK